MDAIIIKMLDSPHIMMGEQNVTFQYKKVEALLYYMVCQKEATREELANLLWGEWNSKTALKNLRHALYSLRKACGCEIIISNQRNRLILNPNITILCDLYDFLEKADVSVYKGEFLKEFYVRRTEALDEWISEQRINLHNQYFQILSLQAQKAMYAGNQKKAEIYAEQYLRGDPTDEEIVCFLMRLYQKDRQFRKAIGLYHDLCKRLNEEFAISPLKETTDLYYKILDEWNNASKGAQESPQNYLIGKDHTLKKLFDVFSDNKSGNSNAAMLIQGESGVGKTFLVNFFLHNYDVSNSIVLRTNCYPSENNAPLSAWNTILYQLLESIREYDIHIKDSYINTASYLFPVLQSAEQNMKSSKDFYEQVSYKAAQDSTMMIFSQVAHERPIAFFFEDIHWMDKTSMDMLSILLHRLHDIDVVAVCTCRNTMPEYVQRFKDGLMLDKLLTCQQLNRFTLEETEQFVLRCSNHSYTRDEIQGIYQSTGGNALILTQLLATAEERGDLDDLPHTLSSIVEYRLSMLPEKDRQVLDLISLFPDSAPFDMLIEILNKDALEVLYICEELKRRTLITEKKEGDTVYLSLAHQTIAEILGNQQNYLTQKILHLRIAQLMEQQMPAFPNADYYSLLAYHFNAGGSSYKGLKYKVLSLNCDSGLFCGILLVLLDGPPNITEPESGIAYFDSLISDLNDLRFRENDSEELDDLEHMIYHAKGSYMIYQGMYEQGVPLLQHLIQMCEETQDISCLLRSHRQMIYYAIQVSDTCIMEKHVNIGLQIANSYNDVIEIANFRNLQGLLFIIQGKYKLAESTLKNVLTSLENENCAADQRNSLSCAYIHCYLGECYRLSNDFVKSYEEFEKAISLDNKNHGFTNVALFYAYYGYAALQNSDYNRAHMLMQKAVSLYENCLEHRGYTTALICATYFDVVDGRLDGVSARIVKARQIDDCMRNQYWHAILIIMEVRIRLELRRQHITNPELEALWKGQSIMAQYNLVLKLLETQAHPIEIIRTEALHYEIMKAVELS